MSVFPSCSHFTALGAVILQLATSVQGSGNNYYAASAEWDSFPLKVLSLQDKHARLEKLLERYGQDGSAIGLEILRHAKKLMVEEVEKLKRREDRAKGRRHLGSFASLEVWRGIAFPATIGVAIQNAEAAYDKLEARLESEQKLEENVRGVTRRAPVFLSFRKDMQNLYVPLELSESRIVAALKTEGVKFPVTLLYGRPGTGKSTVTRQVSLMCADVGMFKHVVLLECGPSVDAAAKEVELIQKLGWNDFPDISQLSLKEESGSSQVKIVRQSRLQSLLAKQKLLIVLDDLWQPTLLQTLLISSGPNVKYLVTSQLGNICKDLNCSYERISIEEDLFGENGEKICRRIFAAHIGYAAWIIPDDFQGLAGKLLDQAEGIPLVIATLGAQIGKADKDDLAVWQDVSASFHQSLKEETPTKLIHGIPYEKSYWSALKQSIQRLGDEVQPMLLLISMCRGPSVPQTVVFFLLNFVCSGAKRGMKRFSQMKMELKSRQLVSESSQNDLAVHSLTKSCLLNQMSDRTQSIAQSFVTLGSSLRIADLENVDFVTKPTLVHSLACLFLDETFIGPLAELLGQCVDKFTESKKVAIQSIIQLLARDLQCTEDHHQSASQVFIQFICHDSLCHDNLSRLLQSSTSVMPTLKFLESISTLDQSFWDKNTLRGILPAFGSILCDRHSPDIQIQAVKTLGGLVTHRANWEDLLGTKSLLHQLVNLMSPSQEVSVQCSGAEFFWYSSQHSSLREFMELQGSPILPVLADALADGRDLHLQTIVAAVLGSLACTWDTSIIQRILKFPGLLSSMTASLAKYHNPSLQETAAQAICSMMALEGVDQVLSNYPGLRDRLEVYLKPGSNARVRVIAARVLIKTGSTSDTSKLLGIIASALEERQDPALQELAALSLHKVCSHSAEMRKQTVQFSGLLESFEHLLEDDGNSGLQAKVAFGLQELSETSNTWILQQLLSFPGLISNVTACLEKCQNPSLQEYAARVIIHMARGGADQLISNYPGLRDKLEVSLEAGSNARLRVMIARALLKIGWTSDTSRLLGIFASALEERQHPALQQLAAWSLGSVYYDSDEMRKQIVQFPGLLKSFEDL